jgi:superoxide dismutase
MASKSGRDVMEKDREVNEKHAEVVARLESERIAQDASITNQKVQIQALSSNLKAQNFTLFWAKEQLKYRQTDTALIEKLEEFQKSTQASCAKDVAELKRILSQIAASEKKFQQPNKEKDELQQSKETLTEENRKIGKKLESMKEAKEKLEEEKSDKIRHVKELQK